MRLSRFVLGTLVAVGLFALASSTAQADHRRRVIVAQPTVVVGGGFYAPVYRPVVVAPAFGYGIPSYGYPGYSRGFYAPATYGFGYSNGFYPSYSGGSFYSRPGFGFGVTFR